MSFLDPAAHTNAVRDDTTNILAWPLVPRRTAAGDQVAVSHRGQTVVYDCPSALHNAVLEACGDMIAFRVSAGARRAVLEDRHAREAERKAHERQVLIRLGLGAVAAGVFAALLYGALYLIGAAS